MNLRDLKSLNSIISEVTKPETQDKSRMIQEGFSNSLSAKARQVVAEQVEGSRGPNPRGRVKKVKDATGSVGIEANRIKASGEAEVARLARKALKRAKRKAATNEEAELDLAEGVNAKRLRILRKHVKAKGLAESEQLDEEWGGGFQSSRDAHREVQAGLHREASANRKKLVADIKAVHSGKMTPAAFTRKHRTKFSELPLAKRMAASRAKAKAKYLAKKAAKADSAPSIMEGMQLDEAGYKRLMRIKKAAYKADLASRSSVLDPTDARSHGKKHSRLMKAAAERTTQVAANMARRGGASADAVRGSGSLMGKRGTFSQKAIKLANQRDKGLAKFRGKAAEGKRWASSYPTADKRASQQRYAKFDNQSRSGDFGQNNQAAMRSTYNYLKRTGKLKTK